MFDRLKSWPRIIAALVGGIGVTGAVSAWGLEYESSVESSAYSIGFDWRVMVAFAPLLVMSYLLGTGREWARRVLLWGVRLIGGVIVLWRGINLFPKSSTDLSPEQVSVVRLGDFFRDLSLFLLVLTLVIFFLMVLSHPDVVASFRRRSELSKRSNPVTQPPAPGGDMAEKR